MHLVASKSLPILRPSNMAKISHNFFYRFSYLFTTAVCYYICSTADTPLICLLIHTALVHEQDPKKGYFLHLEKQLMLHLEGTILFSCYMQTIKTGWWFEQFWLFFFLPLHLVASWCPSPPQRLHHLLSLTKIFISHSYTFTRLCLSLSLSLAHSLSHTHTKKYSCDKELL